MRAWSDGLQLSRRAALACVMTAIAGRTSAQPVSGGVSLRVLAAGSALHGLRPAAAAFTRETGTAVQVATDHGHNIRKHALSGELDADLILVPTEWADEIVAAGRADKATLVPIGSVRIGAAVRADGPMPDVSSMEALRRALVSAEVVLLTLAPTGDHLMKVIERLGLASIVTPKLKRFDTATLLNKHLSEHPNERALGFGPATEILAGRDKGIAFGGPIPEEIQVVLPYSAAMLSRAQIKPAAQLLAFLSTPAARKLFQDSGVE